ncbi:MAG: hypothetical protein ACREC5_05860, partial [Thermoplasmata archaeon]
MESQSPRWEEIAGSGGPQVITTGAITYDAADGYLLPFGFAQDASRGSPVAETWALADNGWTEFYPSESPPVTTGFGALAYDPVVGEMVLYGGYSPDADGAARTDTWTFSVGTWTEISVGEAEQSWGLPAAMAVDNSTGNLTLLSDGTTWQFASEDWIEVDLSGPIFTGVRGTADFPAGFLSVCTAESEDGGCAWVSAWVAPLATLTSSTPGDDLGDTIQFIVSAQSPGGEITYTWGPTDGLGCTLDVSTPQILS